MYRFLMHSPEAIGFENHFVILCCVLACIAFVIGFIVNVSLSLGLVLELLSAGGILFYSILYIIARFYRKYQLAKIVFIISVSIFLDLLWLSNYGSYGPIIYIYIVAYSGFLFLFSGKQLIAYTLYFFLNTTGMFLLEYLHPDYLGNYTDNVIRTLDVYSGLFIYLTLASFLMLYIKTNYIRERDRAKRSEKLKSSFLANMSHEIRTPLNSMMGFVQLLDKELPSEKRTAYVKNIYRSGHYLLQIIDDILDISRIEAGELKINNTRVELIKLFEDVEFMLHHHYNRFISTKAKIHCQVDPDNLSLYSDYMRLKQILLNLLSNAMKYTEEGEILYSAELQNNSILFRVKDTGMGIKKSYQHEIFNRFRKLEYNSSKIFSGTGIGLSITKELVERLGGKIWFTSVENQGTEFLFSIPKTLPEEYN